MSELVVTVKRVINAPIDRVFQAWVEPEQMKQWFSPEGMTTPSADTDPKKGGTYHVTMKMGEHEFTQSGQYLTFDPPHTLAFTWNDATSIVDVTFKEVTSDKTEVVLKHTGFVDKAARDEHDQGWVGTVNKLTKHFTNPS